MVISVEYTVQFAQTSLMFHKGISNRNSTYVLCVRNNNFYHFSVYAFFADGTS